MVFEVLFFIYFVVYIFFILITIGYLFILFLYDDFYEVKFVFYLFL